MEKAGKGMVWCEGNTIAGALYSMAYGVKMGWKAAVDLGLIYFQNFGTKLEIRW